MVVLLNPTAKDMGLSMSSADHETNDIVFMYLIVVATLVLGAFVGFYSGYTQGLDKIKKQAISHDYATYSPKDGTFVWKATNE